MLCSLCGFAEDTGEAQSYVLYDGEAAPLGGVNHANVLEDLRRQQPVDVVQLLHVRAVVVGHC